MARIEVSGPAGRMLLTMTNSPRVLRPSAQPLWMAARQTCARSRELIRESQVVLDLHREVVATLRSAVPGSTAPTELVTNGGPPVRPSELSREVEVGPLRLLPLRRTV